MGFLFQYVSTFMANGNQMTSYFPSSDGFWCRWTVIRTRTYALNMEFLDTPQFNGFLKGP